jgi:predicted DNA-binding ribbon-helix-helix protein
MTAQKPRRSAAWSRALDAVEKTSGGLIRHNLFLANRRTSLRLDALTWNALREIATHEGVNVHRLCASIDERKPRDLSLTVAVRCYVLEYFCHASRSRGATTLH